MPLVLRLLCNFSITKDKGRPREESTWDPEQVEGYDNGDNGGDNDGDSDVDDDDGILRHDESNNLSVKVSADLSSKLTSDLFHLCQTLHMSNKVWVSTHNSYLLRCFGGIID